MDSNGNVDLYFGIGRSDGVEYGYIKAVEVAFVIVPQWLPVYDLMKITCHKKGELKLAN